MKKIIGVVGKPFKNTTKYIDREKYSLILLKDSDIKVKGPEEYEDIITLDFSSKNSLLKSLNKNLKYEIHGLISIYENYVLPRTWIGEALKVPVPSEESAKALTDKLQMRKKFHQYNPNITPMFKSVKSIDDIFTFTKKYNYPVILKPTNLVKSLLIVKCNNDKEVKEAYTKITSKLDEFYKKERIFTRKPAIIVEEYMTGTMHTVAAFSDSNGKVTLMNDVVDITMARDIGIDDNFLFCRTIPSILDPQTIKQIKEVALEGMKALEAKACPGHIELFLTKQGPKIIEIGGRLGGYRQEMYLNSSDNNLMDIYSNICVGETFKQKNKSKNYSKVLELFAESGGKYNGIKNLAKLQKLESLKDLSIVAKKDSVIGLAKDGFKFAARIILENTNKQSLINDYNFILKNVNINTL